MRMTFLKPAIVLAAILFARAAAAQDWTMPWSDPRDRPPRVDFSASAGFLMPTDWSDLVLLGSISAGSGVLEQVLVRELRVEPASVFDGAVTYWKGNYGFRVQAARSRSSLAVGSDVPNIGIDTWLYDVRGAIGMGEYTPRRWVWPYAFVGLGGITYDLSRRIGPPLVTFVERAPARTVGQDGLIVLTDRGRQFLLAVDELALETVFAVNVGVGTDFRIPIGAAGVGLRVELSDHVAPSPVSLDLHQLGEFGAAGTAIRFSPVHHFRATAGLVLQIGR